MTGLNIQSLTPWGEGVRKKLLKHRGQSDVQHDGNFPKRTYSLINLFSYSPRKRCAFTLAEVLITLGIIGVVAALTIPSLVSHYQRKVLETQFKKSYSILSQAMIPLQSEFLSCPAGSAEEIKKLLFSQFNNLGSSANSKLGYDSFKTYTKKITTAKIHPNCFANIDQVQQFKDENIIATDGMAIAFCLNQTYGNMISIDTNGPKKGPNAFGHDLFFFHLNWNNCNLEPMTKQWRDCTEDDEECEGGHFKWTAGNCSKDSNASENGFACTQYAIANTCPDGSGKGYFDCLP